MGSWDRGIMGCHNWKRNSVKKVIYFEPEQFFEPFFFNLKFFELFF